MSLSSLRSALERSESSGVKERSQGLEDLKRIFRQNPSQTLFDGLSLETIFDRLERIIASDKAAYRKSLASSSKTVKSGAASRLTESFSVYRRLVESTARGCKWKTIRNLLEYLTDVFLIEDGEPCEPLALDAAKSINEILLHRPHLEHITPKDWLRLSKFFLTVLPSLVSKDASSRTLHNFKASSGQLGRSSPVKSSHQQVQSSSQPKMSPSLRRPLALELARSLRLLTSSPTCPMVNLAKQILNNLIRCLSGVDSLSNVEGEMFGALRNTISATCVETVTLLQDLARPLLDLLNHWWTKVPARSISLKDDLLGILWMVLPYVEAALKHQSRDPELISSLEALFDSVLQDYGARPQKDYLRLDDLRFSLGDGDNTFEAFTFSLRLSSAASLRNWALLTVIVSLMSKAAMEPTQPRGDREHSPSPTKRSRQNTVYDELVGTARRFDRLGPLLSLQLMTFYTQSFSCSLEGLHELLDLVMPQIKADDSCITSWAMLTLSSFARQACAKHDVLKSHWSSIWDTANRAMSTAATSRAACHLMCAAVCHKLVPTHLVDDLAINWQSSLDVLGPSAFEDSSIALIQIVLIHCRRSRPSIFQPMAKNALAWAFRTWDPGSTNSTTGRSTALAVTLQDLLDLLVSCAQQAPVVVKETLPADNAELAVWKTYDTSRSSLVYLLNLDDGNSRVNTKHGTTDTPVAKTGDCEDDSVGTVLAELLVRHTSQLINEWETRMSHRLATIHETFIQTAVLMMRLCEYMIMNTTCTRFVDYPQIEKLYSDLSHATLNYLTSPECSSAKADFVGDILFAHFDPRKEDPNSVTPGSAALTSLKLQQQLYSVARKLGSFEASHAATFNDDMDATMDDFLDVEPNPRSFRSTNGTQASSLDSENALSASFDRMSCARLYAKLHSALLQNNQRKSADLSSLKNELADMNTSEIVSGRHLLLQLQDLGVVLDEELTYFILSILSEILKSYSEERSDFGIQLVLRFLLRAFDCWIATGSVNLKGIVLDLYEFFVSALSQNLLSCTSQEILSDLLTRIWQSDENYGQGEDPPLASVRTILFGLVANGNVALNLYQGQNMEIVFSFFTPANHDALFDDLLSNLAIEADWFEGIAVRLYFLRRLGSKWHSLMRKAIYHIFEAAGNVSTCVALATKAILEIAERHQFEDSPSLFRPFCSQLIHTWMAEKHSLTEIPFAIFGYPTLSRLIEDNVGEIVAQCFLYNKTSDLEEVKTQLHQSEIDLVRRSFSDTFAYAMAHDVSHDTNEAKLDGRIRELFSSKTEYKTLVQQRLPKVLTKLLISTHLDNGLDRILEKKADVTYALKTLNEIQRFSADSTPPLPALQPCFRGKFLVEGLERVARRAGLEKLSDLFDCPIFTACARGLLDAMTPQLGSLHARNIIQRLRLLCALGKDALKYRYPAEMLLRVLRPLLLDARCADDTIGIAHFVFDQHKPPLFPDNTWLAGSILETLQTIQMSRHMEHDVLTQDSQRRATQSNLQKFRLWLTQYVASQVKTSDEKCWSKFQRMVQACSETEFPASFDDGSAASKYLLLLLDDENADVGILPPDYRRLLIKSLLKHSTGSKADKNASHINAIKYSAALWRATRALDLSDDTASWVATILGRSYSEDGPSAAEELSANLATVENKTLSYADSINASRSAIVTNVIELLASDRRLLASAAESSLREMIRKSTSEHDSTALELIPLYVSDALNLSIASSTPRLGRNRLQAVEAPRSNIEDHDHIDSWFSALAEHMIRRRCDNPLFSMLSPIVGLDSSFARSIAGPLSHLFLCSDASNIEEDRLWLSRIFKSTFPEVNSIASQKSNLLLAILIYILKQPMQEERTRIDRFNWLDIQYIDAIRSAVDCKKPIHALYLLELLPKTSSSGSRTSRRSLDQSDFASPAIPHEVLVSIYESISEVDSFYSVERSSSMVSILQKVDREDDPFKSLLLHSACLDASRVSRSIGSTTNYMQSVSALSKMHLDGLVQQLTTHTKGNVTTTGGSSTMMTAQRLYEWDIGVFETSSSPQTLLFSTFRGLHNASTASSVQDELCRNMAKAIRLLSSAREGEDISSGDLQNLALMADIRTLMDCNGPATAMAVLEEFDGCQKQWDAGRQAELIDLVAQRETIFGILRRNKALQADLKLSPEDCLSIEMKAVLRSLDVSRGATPSRGALTAAVYLSNMVPVCADHGIRIDAWARLEMATVLWDQNEPEVSIKLLESLVSQNDLDLQMIPVGRAGLLAQLGHQVAEARLERPEEIADKYLKPALNSLVKDSPEAESGKVYYEFASFCDQQLQNPESAAELKQLKTLRERRLAERKQLEKLFHETSSEKAKAEIKKNRSKVRQWLELDDAEYKRMLASRDEFVQQCLQNYLQALSVSEKYNIHVVRFFALWLKHYQSEGANTAVEASLDGVASWKFAALLNQLMSSLLDSDTKFQALLTKLVSRICAEHPYHSIYHLFASSDSEVGKNDATAKSRKSAATKIANVLRANKRVGPLVNKVWSANSLYHNLATASVDSRSKRLTLRHVAPAYKMNKAVSELGIPPATIHLELRPAADYRHVPTITHFRDEVVIMNGLSAPKLLTARASDGEQYKQLFKGGNDDLRQDAIMEQVFSSVSNMLRSHTATRRRNLHVRTYIVLPLSSTSGIIEFVRSSLPLGDYLGPAHEKYHPSDLKTDKARQAIRSAQDSSKEQRIAVYRNVANHYQPVLRYFFFERFEQPDQWFSKRLAYARSTAAMSILGHVLGLGDRHGQNILLDERTGEVIHIDLGIAFGAGRVLPVPELVPFRLTRDVVDGLGASGVEGVFRRCSEAVLTALREDKPAIMTLLDVLRYDPLYSWSVSPLRARRMQDEAAAAAAAGVDGAAPPALAIHEPVEAEDALKTVEKKLSAQLSARAAVSELIQDATSERNLALLFAGWAAFS